MKALVAVLFFAMLAMPAAANKHRGVWFWAEAGSPYGSEAIVGVPVLENQTINFLSNRWVRRVYGSYGNRPVTEPPVIASWNAKLNAAGIQSQCLLSENTWIFAANRPALLSLITQRVLNFNSAPGRTAAEKFDAIHLDIEPQALPEWGTLTPSQKRDYLIYLAETFAAVRSHLVAAGVATFPVYADLPVWFDNLPADGGSIGWLSAADRNLWFADIAASLTGITLMPFDRTTFSSIDNGVVWERANVSGAVVRVGLEVDIGTGQTWASVPDFDAMMETVELAYGPNGAVDIQSYRLWREEIAAQPILPVAAVLRPAQLANVGDIIYPTEAGWTHVILHSIDLCAWQEIKRVRASESATASFPVQFTGRRGFWKVVRFEEATASEIARAGK